VYVNAFLALISTNRVQISYVKKLAMLITSYTETPYTNALVEAVWMASSDGLFTSDLFSWDSETGVVRAELKSCFPLSMQPKREYNNHHAPDRR
jgi:hypothetical protein